MSEYDDSEAKFRLRQEFREDFDDDAQPSLKEVLSGNLSPSAGVGENFVFGTEALVGHGEPTNNLCGTWRKLIACSTPHLHKAVFDKKSGLWVDMSHLTDVRCIFHSCDKPTCRVCYERGWATKTAGVMEFRLEEGQMRLSHLDLGEGVLHIVVSLDPSDYGLSKKEIREKVIKGLEARGVVGGCLIPHWARFDKDKWRWYLGIHFHCLGFVRGGMRMCRGCKYAYDKGSRFFCGGCDGFYGHSKELWKEDKLIVEVLEKRKSVFGTSWYQLHHCTVDLVKKRRNVVVWFGALAYRKMHISKALFKAFVRKRKPKCRICGGELVRHEYVGKDPKVLALFKKRRGAREKIEPFYLLTADLVMCPEKWENG